MGGHDRRADHLSYEFNFSLNRYINSAASPNKNSKQELEKKKWWKSSFLCKSVFYYSIICWMVKTKLIVCHWKNNCQKTTSNKKLRIIQKNKRLKNLKFEQNWSVIWQIKQKYLNKWLFNFSLNIFQFAGVEAIDCNAEPKNNEGRLRKTLFCNYDRDNRPILRDGPITIRFKMIIKGFMYSDTDGKLIVSTWLAMVCFMFIWDQKYTFNFIPDLDWRSFEMGSKRL